ncbi:MAG: pentapeptide repeat-containing protein [Myxococcota bacterium]
MSGRALTFLHLSDLQFGKHHLFEDEGVGVDEAYDTLFERLRTDLVELRDEHELRPDVVLLTGDLAEWGMRKEFDQVEGFATKLQDLLSLERRRILVVPGNHDVNRKLCEAYFSECEGDGEEPVPPYWKKWKHYHRFFARFYDGIDDYGFSEDEPWTLFEFPALKLVVAGLNSTIKESHRDEDHYGWVGERQLRWFSERLRRNAGWLRVAAIHHNVIREAQLDDENLRDADDMRRILSPHINMVMHGHRHEAGVKWWDPSLPILAAGSAAVSREWRPQEVPNQYQLVRVERARLSWWSRMYAADQTRFVADPRGSADGNTWSHEREVRFIDIGEVFPDISPASRLRMPAGLDEPTANIEAFGAFGTGPGGRRSGHDELIDRVVPLVRLRESNVSEVAVQRVAGLPWPYLRVTVAEPSGVVHQLPVAVFEGDLDQVRLEAFLRRVVARYRATDPSVRPLIIHGGRAPEALVEQAHREYVRIQSLAQYRGLPDLRPVVEQMVERLSDDEIYPSSLYVAQRMALSLRADSETVDDAFAQLEQWLRTPEGALTLVLGDFGTGKTFLLREAARRLGRAHLDGSLPLVPLLIEMRELDRSRDLDDLLGQTLMRAGVQQLNRPVFRHMLDQGQIVLLFDGFDELALRVRYERAAEHLGTVLQAAMGDAKVIITSRTQHFLDDDQVVTALFDKARRARNLRAVRLLPFDGDRILAFLRNKLGAGEAEARYQLMQDVNDLVGLSENPRMLNFIAELDRDDLEQARQRSTDRRVTPAAVYELLIERWLRNEEDRAHPPGMVAGLTAQECHHAVTQVALALWGKTLPHVAVDELVEEVRHTLDRLGSELDRHVATHAVGSGTLLVRDAVGRFRFVHQSVMEWLVARDAANYLESGTTPPSLEQRDLSPLMIEFLADLSRRETLGAWARTVLEGKAQPGERLHTNALAVLDHLGESTGMPLRLAGQDLRGERLGTDLSGADLSGADLRGLRLIDADLRDADLSRAQLSGAVLNGANLGGANLTGADLHGVRLLGADLRGAVLDGASLRQAALVGATLDEGALVNCDTFGAAGPDAAVSAQLDVSGYGGGRGLALDPDGTLMAVASFAGPVVIREVVGGRVVAVLRGHVGGVGGVAWSSDGTHLASAGFDGTVRLWSMSTATQLTVLKAHEGRVWSVAWSLDGARLASAGSDGTVRMWDIAAREPILTFDGHTGRVWSVAWSPDGRRLVSVGDDGTIRLWEPTTGALVETLEGHAGRIWGVGWSPDGTQLASAGSDGTVRRWDCATGKQRAKMRGHTGKVNTVAWSNDGERLASGGADGTIRLWSDDGDQLPITLSGHSGSVWGVAWSADDKQLVSTGSDGTVRLWDVPAGKQLANLDRHAGSIWGVDWDAEGMLLASAGSDGTVRLWDTEAIQQLACFGGHADRVNAVAWAPGGEWLASAGYDGTVRIWGTSMARQLARLDEHTGSVWSVAWSFDGTRVASAGDDGMVRLWDLRTTSVAASLAGHEGKVWSVAWSERRLASAGDDGTIRLWNTTPDAAGELTRVDGHEGRVNAVAWSDDGARLASVGDDGAIRLWKPSPDGTRLEHLASFDGHPGALWAVAWSDDSTRLASAGSDGTVRLWDVPTARPVVSMLGRGGPLYTVALHPDGRWLAASGPSGTLDLFDVQSGRLVASLLGTGRGWAVITPEGGYKTHGDVSDVLWQRIGLCRFELDELDRWLPTSRRLPVRWRLE